MPRIERFQYLMNRALNLLKTEEFDKLEAAIKKNALEQLGLDADADAIDLFFTPLSTMDFYKSLDIIIKDHGFSISATEVGEGFQNAIVLAVLRAFEETHRSGAILLIEEPEMFLHPQMQRSLYKTLRKIADVDPVVEQPVEVALVDQLATLAGNTGDDGDTWPRKCRHHEIIVQEFPDRASIAFRTSRV